ncbi:DUF2452 domain-containing protein [Telluribacter sp.]|jgi:hypothetical protein|uniref:DUF2452 domain-containing protein n=1 Tax=Telluribacter sp. TaxID=1978767 RepID=UPI002E150CAC|nr:DUF2452 domain-containing protein [Telluribacter sp.]
MSEQEEENEKIAQNPGLMEYAHTAGGAVIRPDDMGKVKGRSVLAMRQQTDIQMAQIYQQMQLLADQANHIKKRVEISERIYSAHMSFEPLIGHTYYLYERQNGTDTLSLIGPNEWGRSKPFSRFVAKVHMLADHTWEVEYHTDEVQTHT